MKKTVNQKNRRIFADDYKFILKAFKDHWTYQKLAEHFGVSRTRIYQVIHSLLPRPEIKKILSLKRFKQ